MDIHITKYENMDNNKANKKNSDQIIQPTNNSQNTKIEKFEVEDRRSLNNTSNLIRKNQENSNEDLMDKVKRIYHQISTNRNVRAVFCPFDDSNEECQICYKICVIVTLFIILFMFYLISVYN